MDINGYKVKLVDKLAYKYKPIRPLGKKPIEDQKVIAVKIILEVLEKGQPSYIGVSIPRGLAVEELENLQEFCLSKIKRRYSFGIRYEKARVSKYLMVSESMQKFVPMESLPPGNLFLSA
jgi:hypothetical protein